MSAPLASTGPPRVSCTHHYRTQTGHCRVSEAGKRLIFQTMLEAWQVIYDLKDGIGGLESAATREARPVLRMMRNIRQPVVLLRGTHWACVTIGLLKGYRSSRTSKRGWQTDSKLHVKSPLPPVIKSKHTPPPSLTWSSSNRRVTSSTHPYCCSHFFKSFFFFFWLLIISPLTIFKRHVRRHRQSRSPPPQIPPSLALVGIFEDRLMMAWFPGSNRSCRSFTG